MDQKGYSMLNTFIDNYGSASFTLHGIKSLLDHKYRTFIDFYRRATQLYYNENP